MGYYNTGAMVPAYNKPVARYRAGVEVGAWIATPGFLRDQIKRLSGEYVAVGKEIHAQYNQRCLGVDNPEAGKPECEKLRRFRDEVWLPVAKQFFAFEKGHESWHQNLWGSTWDNIVAYREKLIQIYNRAKEAGYAFQSPEPAPVEPTPWADIGKALKWVLILVLTIAGAWVIKMVVETVRG